MDDYTEISHCIENFSLEIDFDNDEKCVELQQKLMNLVQNQLGGITERVFDDFENGNVVFIDKLDIDLKNIPYYLFENDFLGLFEKSLRAALQSKISLSNFHKETSETQGNNTKLEQARQKAFYYYLNHGVLPFWGKSVFQNKLHDKDFITQYLLKNKSIGDEILIFLEKNKNARKRFFSFSSEKLFKFLLEKKFGKSSEKALKMTKRLEIFLRLLKNGAISQTTKNKAKDFILFDSESVSVLSDDEKLNSKKQLDYIVRFAENVLNETVFYNDIIDIAKEISKDYFNRETQAFQDEIIDSDFIKELPQKLSEKIVFKIVVEFIKALSQANYNVFSKKHLEIVQTHKLGNERDFEKLIIVINIIFSDSDAIKNIAESPKELWEILLAVLQQKKNFEQVIHGFQDFFSITEICKKLQIQKPDDLEIRKIFLEKANENNFRFKNIEIIENIVFDWLMIVVKEKSKQFDDRETLLLSIVLLSELKKQGIEIRSFDEILSFQQYLEFDFSKKTKFSEKDEISNEFLNLSIAFKNFKQTLNSILRVRHIENKIVKLLIHSLKIISSQVFEIKSFEKNVLQANKLSLISESKLESNQEKARKVEFEWFEKIQNKLTNFIFQQPQSIIIHAINDIFLINKNVFPFFEKELEQLSEKELFSLYSQISLSQSSIYSQFVEIYKDKKSSYRFDSPIIRYLFFSAKEKKVKSLSQFSQYIEKANIVFDYQVEDLFKVYTEFLRFTKTKEVAFVNSLQNISKQKLVGFVSDYIQKHEKSEFVGIFKTLLIKHRNIVKAFANKVLKSVIKLSKLPDSLQSYAESSAKERKDKIESLGKAKSLLIGKLSDNLLNHTKVSEKEQNEGNESFEKEKHPEINSNKAITKDRITEFEPNDIDFEEHHLETQQETSDLTNKQRFISQVPSIDKVFELIQNNIKPEHYLYLRLYSFLKNEIEKKDELKILKSSNVISSFFIYLQDTKNEFDTILFIQRLNWFRAQELALILQQIFDLNFQIFANSFILQLYKQSNTSLKARFFESLAYRKELKQYIRFLSESIKQYPKESLFVFVDNAFHEKSIQKLRIVESKVSESNLSLFFEAIPLENEDILFFVNYLVIEKKVSLLTNFIKFVINEKFYPISHFSKSFKSPKGTLLLSQLIKLLPENVKTTFYDGLKQKSQLKVLSDLINEQIEIDNILESFPIESYFLLENQLSVFKQTYKITTIYNEKQLTKICGLFCQHTEEMIKAAKQFKIYFESKRIIEPYSLASSRFFTELIFAYLAEHEQSPTFNTKLLFEVLEKLVRKNYSFKTNEFLSNTYSTAHLVKHGISASQNDFFKRKQDIYSKQEVKTIHKQTSHLPFEEHLYISNAGLILLIPYLKPLFMRLQLLSPQGEFKDEFHLLKAISALQYAVEKNTLIVEYELVLNKILCGAAIDFPITEAVELNDEEKNEIENLLTALIKHWGALKGTGNDSFRVMFLKREGKIHEMAKSWELKIERQSYDILLDKIPWTIQMQKTPWMEKMIVTDW